ncbi:MAG TPA: iron-containing redox enzyme family protein [Actinocatenispora sp.]
MHDTRRPAGTPAAAPLPAPRGELSEHVLAALTGEPGHSRPVPPVRAADPYGEDLHLTLYACYELHYRSFAGVDPRWEWDPGLLGFRASAEAVFLAGLRADTPGGDDPAGAIDELLVEPVDAGGVAQRLRDRGSREQMREYIAHRSIYHLKEADPQAWVIPRLSGPAKAALVAVEYDEYGAGRGDRMHQRLFADLMTGLGLDAGYLAYLDRVPAPMLTVVNLMSLLGLHRAWRGALVGHFAAAEITTPPSARRMADALRRLGAPDACVEFYTEHVEADAVHEQVMRHDVVDELIRAEPGLAPDVAFGVEATTLVEDRFADHVLRSWDDGRTSLRTPLAAG